MSTVFPDRYWRDKFQITTADLNRIARRMRETGTAYDLTELAKRVVRGRLRHGPETSTPAQAARFKDPSVRLWDPAGEWQVGNHVIVARRRVGFGYHEPFVGEITDVKRDKVHVFLPGLSESKTYLRAPAGSDKAQKWHKLVRDVVEAMQRGPSLEEQVDFVILEHGQHVVSQLLNALKADERFVRLAGRWFLRELAVLPTEEQIIALAWAMIKSAEPQPTEALVVQVKPPLAEGDPGLFGLYLSTRQRPNLFKNAAPGQRPRWMLAGPPSGSFTPRCAAYDPKTYEVLCQPGEVASSEVVQQLWELDLLQAVV